MRSLDLFRLDEKIVLVSGGAGIAGSSISRGLAEAGATVVISSRNAAACEKFCDTLTSDGLQAIPEPCDFTSEASIIDLRTRILDRFGKIDVLFNNAVSRAGGELSETTAADWESVMALNSTGLFLSCRIFSEPMIQQRSGSIVNIASIYGMVGPDFSIYEGTPVHNSVSYSFAKGGMINLTRYLASYLAPYNIRVNTISPGGVLTPETPPHFIENYNRRVPLGRMASGSDLYGAAILLASDASSYITGQNIAVDGGWTAI